jgi:hypothetical protein
MNGQSGPRSEDLRIAANVGPETLGRYLATVGWRASDLPSGGKLWITEDGGDEFEVVLPAGRELRDFPMRMFDALNTLSVVEDRSIDSIVADLSNQDTDTMTFRLLPDGPPGTVPLFDGVTAVEGVRELVLATAYASVVPRPLILQGRRPSEVLDFARQVRLGAPQSGSWIVSVQMDVSSSLQPNLFDEDELASLGAPLSLRLSPRRVSLQMHQTLRATLAAAGESLRVNGGLESFERRVNEGVSANVCGALAQLGRGSAFEVRFAWAQRQPPNVGSGRFRFDARIVGAVRQAYEGLRIGLPEGRIELVGSISKLSREGQKGGGTATLEGAARLKQGDAEVRVDVRLAPQWYNAAVDAHRNEQVVRIVGSVYRGRVDSVQSVEVLHRSLDDNDGRTGTGRRP